MKRILPIVLLVALAAAGTYFWWPRAPEEAPEVSTAKASSARSPVSTDVREGSRENGEPEGAPAAGLDTGAPELTPEQAAKLDRLDAEDARATAARVELFESNIAAVDEAIAKGEAEGAHEEYLAALEKRRALLIAQAAAEAQP